MISQPFRRSKEKTRGEKRGKLDSSKKVGKVGCAEKNMSDLR